MNHEPQWKNRKPMHTNSPLLDYLTQVRIIHLRNRVDRYTVLVRELANVGLDINDDRVQITDAICCSDDNAFPSPSVFGSFLSHLKTLREAHDKQYRSILVLEDDAIFRSFFSSEDFQKQLVDTLSAKPWDICYFGHPVTNLLKTQPKGLINTNLIFRWSHCYAVHQRILPELIAYLEATMERPAGHPEGGKMYFDGALSMFRERSPNVVTLISNPTFSIQRGSISTLADRRWYDKVAMLQLPLNLVRAIRDELWRRTGYFCTHCD
jgi:GR25 family glycosyltransferase involved in LPS biosynthesis